MSIVIYNGLAEEKVNEGTVSLALFRPVSRLSASLMPAGFQGDSARDWTSTTLLWRSAQCFVSRSCPDWHIRVCQGDTATADVEEPHG